MNTFRSDIGGENNKQRVWHGPPSLITSHTCPFSRCVYIPHAYVLSLRLWFIFLLKSKMKNEKNRDKKADHEGCHTATLVDYFGVFVLSWGRKKCGVAWTRSRHHSGVLSLSVNEKREIFHFFYLLGRGRYIENKTASYIKILGRNQSRT